MSVDCSSFVCRLCQKSNTWFIDIFDSSETDGILVCEVIRELVQLEVDKDDGLPGTACHECWKRLAEFQNFKKMCFKSADDLRRKTVTPQDSCRAEERFTVKVEPIEYEEDPSLEDVERTAQDTKVKWLGHDSTVCRSPAQEPESSSDGVVPQRDVSSYQEDVKCFGDPSSLLKPVEVFVNVAADCGLPVGGDGLAAEEERDPLGADGDVNNPSTLITIVPSTTTERSTDVLRKKVKREPSASDSVMLESSSEARSSMAPSTSVMVVEVPPDTKSTSVPPGPWPTGSPWPAAKGTAPVPPVMQGPPHPANGTGPGRKCTDVDGKGHPLFHQCNECGKVCISRYLLKIHKRLHDAEDQFLCKSCGKRFRTKGNLKIHIRTHTDKDNMDALDVLRSQQKERERQQSPVQCNWNQLCDLRGEVDPFALSEDVFKGLYRVSKELARRIAEELRPYLKKRGRRTVEQKVLFALHFFGHGEYPKNEISLGLSQRSAFNIIVEVIAALNDGGVLAKWIPFPVTKEERRAVILKNYLWCKIPGVIGYVDGAHIPVTVPRCDGYIYHNRMHFDSMNAMIVCDSDKRILNVVARFGGSSHDSHVWNRSMLKDLLVEMWAGGEQGWILGDSAYPHEPWLQTPIVNATCGSREERYTQMHAQAMKAVGECVRMLKARFKCLQRSRVLKLSPTKVGQMINACAALHNMCLHEGLNDAELSAVELDEDDTSLEQLPGGPEPPTALLGQAVAVRQRIVCRLQPLGS